LARLLGVDGPRGAHLTLTIGLVSTPRTRPDRLLVASDAWSARYRLQGWKEAVPGVLGRPGIDSTVFGEECDSGTSHSSELADHGKRVKCDMESKSSLSEGIQESFREPRQGSNRKCHHPLARLSHPSVGRLSTNARLELDQPKWQRAENLPNRSGYGPTGGES
jgi:hypothetical protein